MKFQKNILLPLTLGASLFSLGACSGVTHPNSMPSGYTYHHEIYKSPAPAESSKVTIEQRQYMDATQAQQFRDAIYDLLERLTMRAGMPPKPVYVLAPDAMTTFYSNIDNDLRESMRHIGYAISDTPQDAYIFTYEALPLVTQADGNASAANNVQLTLRIFSGLSESANQLTEETGQYFIQGAEALKIQPPRYNVSLPQAVSNVGDVVAPASVPVSPAPVVSAPAFVQQPVTAPAVRAEPVVSAPPVIEPVQVVKPAIARASKIVSPALARPAPVAKIPTPVVEPMTPPSTMMEPRKALSIPTPRVPSSDDIIIINRGDKAAMAVEIPEPPAATNNAIQGRVSNPADY